MTHYETQLNVNNEWRTLLVVKSDVPQEFSYNLTFEEVNSIITYFTKGVYRSFETDGEFIYWFLPTGKEITYIKDEVARESVGILNALLDENSADKLQAAEQFRRAMQMFATGLSDDQAMEVATVFDSWKVGKAYSAGEYCTYGVNSAGDPQLYKIVQAHTSQDDWAPDVTASLYEPIGLTEAGYPVWSQPSGAHDAYNTGDIVEFEGALYSSLIDGNVYSPSAYPAGWEVYVA